MGVLGTRDDENQAQPTASQTYTVADDWKGGRGAAEGTNQMPGEKLGSEVKMRKKGSTRADARTEYGSTGWNVRSYGSGET